MMYSQLNYLGCFIPISKNSSDMIGNQIETFVTGNIRIAKKRLYSSPENGGLGLFNITDFLDSQKVSWIARAANLDEVWKVRIYLSGCGSIFHFFNLYFLKRNNRVLTSNVHVIRVNAAKD
jgi:hypothetical protein